MSVKQEVFDVLREQLEDVVNEIRNQVKCPIDYSLMQMDDGVKLELYIKTEE